MGARLTLASVGPGATIQDGGRAGFLRFGVTPAGPMDWTAFETANRALGNPADAAAIEIGLGGLALTTEAPITLAFAGGGFAWTRGGRHLPSAARIMLRPGESLQARSGAWGAFTYCAVPGGLDVPAPMGSRATHVRSMLGGLDGRMLQGGDHLVPRETRRDLDDTEIVAPWLLRAEASIRITLGPQDDHFTEAAIAALAAETFELTAAADRMAYKLKGPALLHRGDYNIVSDGVALGAIQVAGDHQPMILMADRQPTGGYPKIGHVCRADIGRLAQLRPGDAVRFAIISVEAARAALIALEDRVDGHRLDRRPLRVAPTAEALMRANLVGGVTDGGTEM